MLDLNRITLVNYGASVIQFESSEILYSIFLFLSTLIIPSLYKVPIFLLAGCQEGKTKIDSSVFHFVMELAAMKRWN